MGVQGDDRPSFVRSLSVVAIPLLIVLLLADLVLHGQTILGSSMDLSGFDPLTLGFVSVLVLGVLFYELKRHGERAARLLMAAVTASGTIAGLILLQAWFTATNTAFSVFFLLAPPIAYIGLYFSFKDYTGTLSRKKAGLLRAISATLLGSVLGAFLPVFFTIPFLILLSILDPLFLESKMLRQTVGMKAFNDLASATTLPLDGLDMGLGDLMAYSMLATTSIVHTGIAAALVTTSLILIGIFFTFQIAKSRHVVPGLPIPIWLGVLPSLVALLF
jgi:hypothetical protein